MRIRIEELNPKVRGRYITVVCPQCGKQEAYIFTDDFKKAIEEGKTVPIRCNRMSKCGETTLVEIVKDGESSIHIKEEPNQLKMSQEGAERIQNFAEFLLHEYQNEEELEINEPPQLWRGISNQTLKKCGILFLDVDKGLRGFMENCSALYSKFYLRKLYERDILIPIQNKQGKVERILLRSRKPVAAPTGKKALKEVSILLRPNAEEVWNLTDMQNTSVLFVTEGVPDALSIKEVAPNAHVVAIPGVGKFKKVVKHLEEFSSIKKIVIAFDGDKAGKVKAQAFRDSLKEMKIHSVFLDLKGYADVNEFLEGDKKSLTKEVDRHIGRRFIIHKKGKSHGKQQIQY